MRVTGLEPALLSEAAPKTAVYANFTTPAYYSIFDFQPIGIIRKSTTVVTLPKSNVSALLMQQACPHTPAYICRVSPACKVVKPCSGTYSIVIIPYNKITVKH